MDTHMKKMHTVSPKALCNSSNKISILLWALKNLGYRRI